MDFIETKLWRAIAVLVLGATAAVLPALAVDAQWQRPEGEVFVRDNRLVRDAHEWIPHGFYQIAFEALPGFPGLKPFWGIASQNFSRGEYSGMRRAGADSVRIQVSQPGLDPKNPLFTTEFRERVISAVRAARASGLSVIISVQDETQSGETTPTDLPNNATRRVWRELAPVFGHDRGVLYELLNEPRQSPSPQNWQAWAEAMNQTIRTVRDSGAVNVVVADGLGFAEYLEGAPQLDDPLRQVAYAAHPYSHRAADQTVLSWDAKFGHFAQRAPVIVTEWTTAVPYYCDANTSRSVVSFLRYLQDHEIGLEAVAWDWSSANFGSAVYDFPQSRFSRFVGPSGPLSCMDAGFGPGAMIETWYRLGVPPSAVQ